MNYKLLSVDNEKGSVMIPGNIAKLNSLNTKADIIIQAGMKSITVKISISDSLEANTLCMPQSVIEYLSLPTTPKYQLRVEGNILHIGPVIGLLFTKRDKRMSNIILEKALGYTFYYNNFNGLLCLLSFDGINLKSSTAKGYYFVFSEEEQKGHWEEGIFPLPSVIYRRMSLSNIDRLNLMQATAGRLFNSFYFNKLTFWNLMSTSASLKPHIPDTRLLRSEEDLKVMLDQYHTVYLKMVNGSLQAGLVRIIKDELYYFQTNDGTSSTVVEGDAEAYKYINQLTGGSSRLLQRGINSLKLDGGVVDFRVVLQKDETLSWSCSGLVAKVGRKNGICSNLLDDGYTLSFEDALSATTSLTESEIQNKKNELIGVCNTLCNELDATGENYGDFGIDIVLDKDLNIWILEANKEQDYNVLLKIYGRSACNSMRSNTTRYAVGLSGFSIIKGKTDNQ